MVNEVNRGNNAKVDYTSNQQSSKKVDAEQKATQTAVQQTQSNKATSDAVTLTPQAQQLKELQKKVENSSGFDQQKVQKVKKAISEGHYQVDVDKLADKIASHEIDLFGR
ncbi:flagellar biosynthesis anti-sigma factor FlgM [Flocculibacter collagenilyticus]|uniref:flagellar biosynthesis anti-sigma factor FlgM n=1 Tax=Flocculibacter collagenilyticus TaxID=2744479 RepID=UPI0018F5F853|nr:flagellar biosynthesis anti-sigma factor FlgM [Flocculibacter collagenilyticus]